MCYNENFNKKQTVGELILKVFLTDCVLQLEHMKGESLVIANQQSCGELVLGLCTNRPSRSERWFTVSGKRGFFAFFALKLTTCVSDSLIGTKS